MSSSRVPAEETPPRGPRGPSGVSGGATEVTDERHTQIVDSDVTGDRLRRTPGGSRKPDVNRVSVDDEEGMGQ